MSPRDFTDEHVRPKIPTIKSGEDPSSPFCTNLNLFSRGPVAQMQVPPGWIVAEKQNSGAHRYSFQNLHPQENSAVMVGFFYRGFRIEESLAQRFKNLIASPVQDLSLAEINSISSVLEDRSNPEYFDLKIAKAKNLNRKQILVIEGFYNHIPEGRLELFVPADSSGTIIQEIYYQAPISDYVQYRQAACNAFDSIVWKPSAG